MTIYMGSARLGANGKATGDAVGDQKQTSTPDYKGEVSMQTLSSFIGSKKWYVIRAKQCAHGMALGNAMKIACNNKHLGYDQSNRLGVISYGINTTTNTECDCSSLVRACIKYAIGKDVGNFTTDNAVTTIGKSGLFDKAIVYKANMRIYTGDIIVTQSKGHIGICTDGYSRQTTSLVKNGVNYGHVLDPIYYADCNPDLKNAFGYDEAKLFNHFLQFGCNESSRWGKTISDFNVQVYASHSPDLVQVFGALKSDGSNGFVYYKHYCEFGHNENRRTV